MTTCLNVLTAHASALYGIAGAAGLFGVAWVLPNILTSAPGEQNGWIFYRLSKTARVWVGAVAIVIVLGSGALAGVVLDPVRPQDAVFFGAGAQGVAGAVVHLLRRGR
jgi:hypothetical protein